MNELGPVDEFQSQVARKGGDVNKSTEVAIDLISGSISGAASIFVGQVAVDILQFGQLPPLQCNDSSCGFVVRVLAVGCSLLTQSK